MHSSERILAYLVEAEVSEREAARNPDWDDGSFHFAPAFSAGLHVAFRLVLGEDEVAALIREADQVVDAMPIPDKLYTYGEERWAKVVETMAPPFAVNA